MNFAEAIASVLKTLSKNGPKFLDGLSRGARALIEVAIVVIFGAIPFFAQAIRFNMIATPEHAEKVRNVLDLAFSHGQIYLYTFAIFGTVVWLAIFDWKYVYTKARLFYIFIVILLGYYLSSLATLDPTFTTFVDPWVVQLGYVTFLLSLLLYWMLLVFRKIDPETPEHIFTRDAKKMARGLKGLPK